MNLFGLHLHIGQPFLSTTFPNLQNIKHTGGHYENKSVFLIFRFDKMGATNSEVCLKTLLSSIL
jgi:hypothetical protein